MVLRTGSKTDLWSHILPNPSSGPTIPSHRKKHLLLAWLPRLVPILLYFHMSCVSLAKSSVGCHMSCLATGLFWPIIPGHGKLLAWLAWLQIAQPYCACCPAAARKGSSTKA